MATMDPDSDDQRRGDLRSVAHRLRHDLGAELGGIVTSCDLIGEILPPENTEVEGLVAAITRCAESARRMIDRTAALLRASADDARPLTDVPVLPIIHNVCIKLELERRKRDATIRHDDRWPTVRGQPEWLALIWRELVGNALVWGGESPRITLGWARGEAETEFRVEDSGPGLQHDRASDPFPAYENLHTSRDNPGLGLPLVRRLVERMGGSPHYARVDGRTRMSFTLPD